MKKSKITFEIEQSRVEVVIGLLIKEVSNLTVEEVKREGNHVERSPTAWASASAKSVLSFMKQTPTKEYFYKDLAKALPKDMKPANISPIMTHMTQKGLVVRTKRGFYRVA